MQMEAIINRLKDEENPDNIKELVIGMKFETRFNLLREIIYHIDIHLAEGNLLEVELLLNVADKISRHLDDKYTGKKQKEIRSMRIITKKKRAKYYEAKGMFKDAVAQYGSIIKQLSMPEEEIFLAEMMMEIGIIEEQTGEKKAALLNFDHASQIYAKSSDDFNYEAALFNCAHVLYDMKFYYKAEEFCKALSEHYKKNKKMMPPVAHSVLELANILELFDKNEEAKVHYEKALDAYRQLNDQVKMSDILNRIGSFEMDDGNIASAAIIFKESLDIKRKIDFCQGRGRLFEALGDEMRFACIYEQAIKYYNLAFNYYDESGYDGKKILLKHKIFKVMSAAGKTKTDMGTFIEKFKKDSQKNSEKIDIERINYSCIPSDGASVYTMRQWKTPYKIRVNRKFLVYLLRNLVRAYTELENEKEIFDFTKMLSAVESEFRKKEGT